MSIKDQLNADLRAAMKNQGTEAEKLRLTTLRNVVGEIATKEKSGKTPVELDDKAVTALLQKQAAGRRETAKTYAEAGHADRAARETAEAEVIEAYLPAALTEEEVAAIIERAVAGAGENPAFGTVMKAVQGEVAGRFDGKTVAGMVKSRLG